VKLLILTQRNLNECVNIFLVGYDIEKIYRGFFIAFSARAGHDDVYDWLVVFFLMQKVEFY
jgi:hypothetical protein